MGPLRFASFVACSVLIGSALGCLSPSPLELGRSLGDLAAQAEAQAEQMAGRAKTGAAARERRQPTVEPPPGYVVMKVKAQLDGLRGNALLLVDEEAERVVPIFVGNTEALSIRLRMAGERFKRPLTHDLLDRVLRRLGGSFVRAQVDELRDNTYIGSVVVRAGDSRLIEIDARPSDAIALAIGNQAPIFMAKQVLDRAGHSIDDLEQLEQEGLGAQPGREPGSNATPL